MKISVVLSAYNHAPYIAETMHSLLAQTYPNVELIAIDDGSTDSSYDILESFRAQCEQRFTRFVCYSHPNKGLTKTLNEALAQAKGDYIFIIGSDDVAPPDLIQNLFDTLSSRKDCDMVIPNLTFIDSNGKDVYLTKDSTLEYEKENAKYCTRWEHILFPASNGMPLEEFVSYNNLLTSNVLNIGYLITRKALIDIKGFDKSMRIEDYAMFLEFIKKYKVTFCSNAFLKYRLHNSNISKNAILMADFHIKLHLREKKYCFENGLQKIWLKHMADLKNRYKTCIKRRPFIAKVGFALIILRLCNRTILYIDWR